MPRESKAALKARAIEIADRLAAEHADAKIALTNWETPWELLVAVILSAQCTDEKVNQVTEPLFRKYRGVEAYAAADSEVLEQEVRSTGFYHNKTKSIIGAARALLDHYGGEVPQTMADMLTLPGVARKTANVVLSSFGVAEGVVVDTHVSRLSLRMGLTPAQKTKTVSTDKIEQDLMALIPQERWIQFGHTMIFHGRRICDAKKPNCAGCVVADICPRRGLTR
jgi:endonuclease III